MSFYLQLSTFQLNSFHHLLQYILFIIYYYYFVDIKTSDEGNYRSLIRNLSTVTYNSVLYFNGVIIIGITDINYRYK